MFSIGIWDQCDEAHLQIEAAAKKLTGEQWRCFFSRLWEEAL
jgi:hypothetical protein